MKKLLPIIFLVLGFGPGSKAQKAVAPPWPGVKYSSVKVFLYNLDNQLYGQYQALKNGIPNFTLEGTGTGLTPEQVQQVQKLVNSDTRVLNEGLSKCYEPHHAVFFYDDQEKIVAAFDVCFLCEGMRFYPAKQYKSEITKYTDAHTKKAQQQLEQLKTVFTQAGIPVFKNTEEVRDYNKKLNSNDTLTLTYDSILFHVFDMKKTSIKTMEEIRSSLSKIPYTEALVYESLDKSISDLVYEIKAPGLMMAVNCHGLHCPMEKLEIGTHIKLNLFKAPFNIGMTRTEFNRLIFPASKKPAHHNTVIVRAHGKKAMLIHFNDKQEADHINIY